MAESIARIVGTKTNARGIGATSFNHHKYNRTRRVGSAAVAVALSMAVAEFSPLAVRTARADATWTGATSTDWNTTTNWSINPAGQTVDVNTNTGNIATISATPTFTPVDIAVGVGTGVTGRVDHLAGTLSTGAGNWMFIGANGGTGVYNLANTATTGGALTGFGQGSGSVAVSGNLYIGGRYFDAGGNGTLNINTTGTVTAALFDVFDSNSAGSGTVNLDNGTVTSSGELWVGAWGTGTGTFNQGGGTVNSASWFVVGRSGNGTYNLTGGTVNAAQTGGNVTVGSFAGATGVVNVSGGTLATPRGFFAGEGGTGTLNVSGSGLVSVGDTTVGLRLGVNAGAAGTVNLNGGTILAPIVTQGAGSGTFNFNGGTLKASAANANFMSGIAAANVVGGAVIDSNGFAITVAQPLLAGGSGGLTKSGAGALTLTGVNAFTGPTVVGAGQLVVGAAGDVNTTSGINVNGSGARFVAASSTAVSPVVTVTNGGVDGTGTINSVQVTNGASNTVFNGNGTTGALTIGSLNFAGAGNFNLNVGSTSPEVIATTLTTSGAGNVLVNATNALWTPGTYNLIGYTTLGGSGFGAFQKGTIAGLSNRQTATLSNPAGFISLTVAGDNPRWSGALSNEWSTAVLTNPKNWSLITAGTPTDYIQGDTVLFNDSATTTTPTISVANVSPSAVLFNNITKNYTLAGGFGIAGTGTLTKQGAAALTISNANTYSGGTTLTEGTLNVNNANAIGTGALTIGAGATLDNTSGSAITLATNNAQTWNSGFTFGGSNALNLGTGAVTRIGATAITVNGSGALTVGGAISGSGDLSKAGTGTLVLAGTSGYTGATTVNAGSLSVTGSVTATTLLSLNNGASLSVSGNLKTAQTNVNNGSVTISGTVTNAGDYWVGLNNGGVGSLTVLSGGTLNGDVVLFGGGGSPTAVATGTGSLAAGGTINTTRWFVVGQSGAAGSGGSFAVNGGTLNVRTSGTTGNIEVGTFDPVVANLDINAGSTVRLQNGASIVMGAQGPFSGTATINHNGGDVTFYSDSGTTVGGTGSTFLGGAGTGTATYNLNGGTLTTPNVTRSGGTGILNLNGGVLKAASNNVALISNLTSVNVKAGGALINSNGNTVSVTQPLLHDAGGPAIDGGFNKSGAGTLTISGGLSTYTGTTVISGGTLQLANGAPPTAVGHYSFDELPAGSLATGAAVANTGSGVNMNGTANPVGGGASIVPGRFGNGLALDGLGSSVDVASKIVDQAGGSAWTFSAWVNSSSPGASLISKNDGNTAWNTGDSVFYMGTFPISGQGGFLPTAVRNAGGFMQADPTPTNPLDGAWHMLTYVSNAGTKAIYVDGVPVAMLQSAFNNADPSTSVRFGYSIDTLADGASNLSGSLDELNFFDSALTPSQILALFNTNTVTGGGQQYLPATTDVNITLSGAALDINNNDQTIGSLTGVAGSAVVLGSGTLTTGGNATSNTFAGAISGTGGLTKVGVGALTLSGPSTFSGGTTISAGKIIANNQTALGAGAVSIAATGKLEVKSGFAGALVLKSVPTVASGGTVDVTNSGIVIDYTGSTPISTVRALALSGALMTSVTTGDPRIAVGYRQGVTGEAFRGVTVDADSILIRGTLKGDTDLNGTVNFSDLLSLAQNYSGTSRFWAQGDFDYNGTVNFSDLLALAQNYGQTVTGSFNGDWTLAQSLAVPEPTTLGMLATAGAMLLRRRRRAH